MFFVQKRLRLVLNRRSPRAKGKVYESRLHWQNKIRGSVSCRQKQKVAKSFIRKTEPLAKNDHVKSSAERQVKAQPFQIFFRGLLIFLFCFLRQVNAADDARHAEAGRRRVDLIFV